MKLFIRNTIYKLISIINKILPQNVEVVILCYHSFSEGNWRFSIDPMEFEKQLEYLLKHFVIISPNEFKDYLAGKRKFDKPAVLLTIDDGYRDVLSIKALLKKYKITPLLFLLSHPEIGNKKELQNDLEMLSINEIKQLINDGWIIGSHTASHADLTAITKHQLVSEIQGSKQQLEKDLNIDIYDFSYPRGRYNEEVLELVKKSGYKYGYTMDDDILTVDTKRLQIPRIGVDQTHSMNELRIITSYWAIQFRKFIKTFFPQLAL